MQATRLYTILLASFFFSTTVSAQVFDSGPSDPSLFTSVVNLPGDFLPDSIGGVIEETTQLNVASGGAVGNFFEANGGSEVNISGGLIGVFFRPSDSEVNISGGTVGTGLRAQNDSEINISGGTVGNGFTAGSDTTVNISGGSVGRNFAAFGEVNISGGSVASDFDARSGSVVNISGGSIGPFFQADEGSVVNISGGTVGIGFNAFFDSVVNISGGSVGDGFTANLVSDVNLFGSVFVLDGLVLDDLSPGEAFTIDDRNVTLTGLLSDGSEFSFDLNDEFIPSDTEFLPSATLTVTLIAVPEPTSTTVLLLGCGLAGLRRKRSAA